MEKAYLLEGFEPRNALRHLEDLLRIPHGSGFERALGDHIAGLAEKKGYETYRDEAGNLLVRVPASPGCEQVPPMLLQGHLDMVLAKEGWVDIDLETEPVPLILEGSILRADGTTLGADNGVGLCNMMALMDAEGLKHPPLELLFTVEEEIGLVGAQKFDMSLLQARRMLNMDCGDPDCLVIGAAGGSKFRVERACETLAVQGEGLRIRIGGLQGGHSGLESGKNRGSAVDFGGRLLAALCDEMPVMLAELETPGACNSIPQSLVMTLAIPEGKRTAALDICGACDRAFQQEVAEVDPGYRMEVTEWAAETAASPQDTRAMADFMLLVPYEVLRRSHRCADWKLCSALLSQVQYTDGQFSGRFSIRANRDAYRDAALLRMETLCRMTGVTLKRLAAPTPPWPEKERSPLRDLCLETYRAQFGEEMTVEVEHGSVEAAIIAAAIPDMDIVGFAPKSRGAHTTKEHLYLDTMAPFWQLLTALLARMCE